MSKVVVTSPERHNCPCDDSHTVWVDGPMAIYGDLGQCANWLVDNVPDKVSITFKGYGPKEAVVTGKGFRTVGLDVLLECL